MSTAPDERPYSMVCVECIGRFVTMAGDWGVADGATGSSTHPAPASDGAFVGDDANLQEALSLLAATLEATADGLLVVDEFGSIRMFNAQFAEMWRIPDDVLAAKDDDKALSFVLDQLADPKGFLAKVRELYDTPSVRGHVKVPTGGQQEVPTRGQLGVPASA